MARSKYDPEFAAGFFPCTVLSGGIGEEIDNNGKPTGRMKARVSVRFEDGPDKGRLVTYEDEINAKSALYVMRSLKACGCKTPDKFDTVAGDIDAWVKETGGKSTVEIRHIELKRGKKYDDWTADGCPGNGPPIWAKANSIGRGPRPLAAPSGEAKTDAEEQMRRAMMDDGAADEAPPPNGDDIPF
jgi:hypothetical protein